MTSSYGIHEKLNYDPPVCNGQRQDMTQKFIL